MSLRKLKPECLDKFADWIEKNFNSKLEEIRISDDEDKKEKFTKCLEKYTETKNEFQRVRAIHVRGYNPRSQKDFLELMDKTKKFFKSMESENEENISDEN